jgi:mannan endo-1,4-beta-mannosidase
MDTSTRRLHARWPRAVLVIGSIAALVIPFVVFATTSGSPYSVLVSKSSSRTSAVSLDHAQVAGKLYVYLTPTSGLKKVSFWLDNAAMTGTATHVENYAPFDFAGTDSAGKAKPWDSTTVGDGNHAISIKIETSSAVSTMTVTFTVANHGAVSTSTPAPVATPKASPAATAKPTAGPTAPGSKPGVLPAGFVGSSGTDFTIGGKAFTFAGFNIWQANSLSNCGASLGKGTGLDTALTDIGSGAGVFRTWFFQREATIGGARDWSAFDHTLAVAKAHGVRVIATLGNQWGSCESPTSQYKWASWYTGGYKTQVLPQNLVPYRDWVAEVVARYKDDPTIAMWQLMNEAEVKVDNTSTCAPASDLYNFAVDVSGLIKSIDPNHLVSLGTMGGSQCGSQGSDYALINSPSTIDVCEFHDYGHETEAMPANLVRDLAACNAMGKPLFVGESGIKATSVGGTLADRAAAFDAKCKAMFAAGVKGFLVWSWNNGGATTGNWPVGPGDPSLSVIASY